MNLPHPPHRHDPPPSPTAAAAPHAAHGQTPGLTRMAFFATLHCLLGCAVGEVLGLIVGTALGWGNGPTMALAIGLAFLFGYAFTIVPLHRQGLAWRAAARIALAADTASIAIMEIVDNAVMLAVPGAMDAGLDEPLFWGALAVSLGAALLAAWPLNRWLLARGRGHALAHAHHAHGADAAPAAPAATHATAADGAAAAAGRRNPSSTASRCGTEHAHAMHG